LYSYIVLTHNNPQLPSTERDGNGLINTNFLLVSTVGLSQSAVADCLSCRNVGNMSVTYWRLVKILLICNRHACRRRHKHDPNTRFLCRGLSTQPYYPQSQPCCSAAPPLSCHRQHPSYHCCCKKHIAAALAGWASGRRAAEHWRRNSNSRSSSAQLCCCLDVITLALAIHLALAVSLTVSVTIAISVAFAIVVALIVATGLCCATGMPSPLRPHPPLP
jgi:hypothetical protein